MGIGEASANIYDAALQNTGGARSPTRTPIEQQGIPTPPPDGTPQRPVSTQEKTFSAMRVTLVAVGTTPVRIDLNEMPRRRKAIISNPDATKDVWIGESPSVATNNGYQLIAGAPPLALDINVNVKIYAISSVAGASVALIQLSD